MKFIHIIIICLFKFMPLLVQKFSSALFSFVGYLIWFIRVFAWCHIFACIPMQFQNAACWNSFLHISKCPCEIYVILPQRKSVNFSNGKKKKKTQNIIFLRKHITSLTLCLYLIPCISPAGWAVFNWILFFCVCTLSTDNDKLISYRLWCICCSNQRNWVLT